MPAAAEHLRTTKGGSRLAPAPAGVALSPLLREERVQLRAVEPDHYLAIDHGDRRRPGSQREQLLQRRRVLTDVLLDKSNALLRKILFLAVARRSARLGVERHAFRHRCVLRFHRQPGGVGVPLRSRACG